jgi:hypothetical protein
MWHDEAVPRLQARGGGLGVDIAVRTYRLTGIGESQVAEILGDDLLRGGDPEVATYARAEAVDVRISAIGRPDRSAEDAVAAVAETVQERLGPHIWATGDTTWSGAIGDRLEARGWDLAVSESGTRGQVGALLGDVEWLVHVESHRDADLGEDEHARDQALLARAEAARHAGPAAVGLAVDVREAGTDMDVAVAVIMPGTSQVEHRTAFLGGPIGRTRAALAAAAILYIALRDATPAGDP